MGHITRRGFLSTTGLAAASMGVTGGVDAAPASLSAAGSNRKPNIVLIMTDDQGYGDLACHGNPHLRTPNLDRLHGESHRMTNFYVSPVCSPTRASLMTGRYNYRTGVVDTFMGRSMMDPAERTIAESLREQGYRTGIFGKWHLGDNYPMRAMDKGFEESLVHRGGGIAQPSDPPMSGYFNPVLQHNGQERTVTGYCTDIFTDATIDFIERHRGEPFFAYLATNAPHVPLVIHERYIAPYREMGLDEETARVYAMIENIDEGVGRVLDALDRLALHDDTIVIFLTDNGGIMQDDAERYPAGLRGKKGTLYEGGVRVPCFIRWPRGLGDSREVATHAAHIDLFPTLHAMAGIPLPGDRTIDGRDLMPLLTGGPAAAAAWPERNIFLQWHRGDEPEPFRDAVVRGPRYKLVNGEALFDLIEDPGETHDIAAQFSEIVADMRQAYRDWFDDVTGTRGFEPPRIHVGADAENPSILTAQDWRGATSWHAQTAAYWELHVTQPGRYHVSLITLDRSSKGRARIAIGGETHEMAFTEWSPKWTFTDLDLPAGDTRLQFEVIEIEGHENPEGVRFAEVARIA